MKGLARDGRSRRLFALAIEAEWRKRAASVVPAQPKAQPEGQRPHLADGQGFVLGLAFQNNVTKKGSVSHGHERGRA